MESNSVLRFLLGKMARGFTRTIMGTLSIFVVVGFIFVMFLHGADANNPTSTTASTAKASSTTTVLTSSDSDAGSVSLPKHASTLRAQLLAKATVDGLSRYGLSVVEAVELEGSNVTKLVLAPADANPGLVYISISTRPGGARLPVESITKGMPSQEQQIRGASEAILTDLPLGKGWQLVAQFPDGIVVNIVSSGAPAVETSESPLSREAMVEAVELIVDLLKAQ